MYKHSTHTYMHTQVVAAWGSEGVLNSCSQLKLCADLLSALFCFSDVGAPPNPPLPEPVSGVFYSSATLDSVLTYWCLFCFSDGLWCPSWTSQWRGVLQQHHTGLCADLHMSVLFQRWTVVPLLNQPVGWCFTAAPHWTLCWPTCVCFVSAMDCGAPPEPANGVVFYSSTTLDSVATYSCRCGFQLDGSSIRRCLSSGLWSGNNTQCNGKQPPSSFFHLEWPQTSVWFSCYHHAVSVCICATGH